jgi:hypothetical protein
MGQTVPNVPLQAVPATGSGGRTAESGSHANLFHNVRQPATLPANS